MSQVEQEEEIGLDSFKLKAAPKVGKFNTEKNLKAMDDRLDNLDAELEETGVAGYSDMDKQIKDSLDNQVKDITETLLGTKQGSEDFKDIASSLHAMGNSEINRTSNLSTKMLNRQSVRSLKNNESGGAEVAKSLSALRTTVVSLDPSRRNKIFKDRVFGIPVPFFGKKIDSYFQEYKTSEQTINDIVQSLYNGKDRLMEDNSYIEEDKEQTVAMMKKLEQYAYVMKKLDERVSDRLPEIEAKSPLKAHDIKQAILFPMRQKRIDLMQHLAVSMQSVAALDVLRANNEELIRGVDRATNTTVAALRNAVVVAEALSSQELVLTQIQAMNEVTNNMMASTSKRLKDQGTAIQQQATTSAIDVKNLQNSFKDILQAMDQMDDFRAKALPNMLETINALEETVNEAKQSLSSNRRARVHEEVKDILEDNSEPESNNGPVQIRKTRKPKA